MIKNKELKLKHDSYLIKSLNMISLEILKKKKTYIEKQISYEFRLNIEINADTKFYGNIIYYIYDYMTHFIRMR